METYTVLVDDLNNDCDFACRWASLEEDDTADFDEAIELGWLL